jgi:hypothetical protein
MLFIDCVFLADPRADCKKGNIEVMLAGAESPIAIPGTVCRDCNSIPDFVRSTVIKLGSRYSVIASIGGCDVPAASDAFSRAA